VNVDFIVVGAGGGGGAAAAVLAEAGRSVLLLERGEHLTPGDDAREHAAPVGAPVPGLTGDRFRARPLSAANTPWTMLSAVGGGTLVWGMQAWRFHPDDFRMASCYGTPTGSSLADWPIRYDDLEPWYTRAEVELGVAGAATPYAPRSGRYPMQPLDPGPNAAWLAAGARRLGWSTLPPPLAVNSRAYGGRAECIRCNECVGFTCPTDAKNGSHNTFVPRALLTGHCRLITQAQATRVDTDGAGRVTGVEYVVTTERRRARRIATARAVMLAGGAIETARLLLLSTSRHHPFGIGNAHDQVGRHLQGHTYAAALGVRPPGVRTDSGGPGVAIATTAHNHGNPGIVGGGMMADDFVKTPVTFWRTSLPPEVPRWGLANKRAMRELYLRVVDLRAPVQEVPTPDNRVTLHPRLRDSLGLPVAHLPGAVHPETVRTAMFMRGRLRAWLEASGAQRTWFPPEHARGLSDWFHQAGTCRMSEDPRDGVVDPSGRVHGHDNLFIADGSVHVTNGGFNPALTIIALALRTANHAARGL
jgi:choline dehydrogenase-like flavoprotein